MPHWARLVTAIAVIRVIVGLALYFSGQLFLSRPPPLPMEAYAVLTTTFGVLGLTLAATNRHDVRATWLGGVFMLVSVPLCTPFLRGRPLEDFGWLLFVRPDAFLPAFLWRFVGEFPAPLPDRSGRLTRMVAGVAAVAGTVVFAVNLSFLIWPPVDSAPGWRQLLRPTAESGSLYYPLVFGLSAAAFVRLFLRALRAAPDDRRRLRLFAWGLVFGLVPSALQAILEVLPAYNAFIHQPGVELAVGLLLFGALGTVPFVTAYSVLFDRIVELRVVLRAAIQYVLARYTIIGATMVPFVALALIVGRHRDQPLTVLLSGPRPMALGFTALLGVAALRLRQPLIDRLDRRFFREQYDARQLIGMLVTEAMHVRDAGELESRIRSSVDRALHADAALYVAGERPGVLQRPGDGRDPISSTGILVTLAIADAAPMDVDPSDDRSPFRRLPAGEQSWLLASRAHLLVALRAPDGRPIGLVTMSAKRSGLPYSDEDRRLLSAVAASISLALDNLRLRSAPEPSAEPAARECTSCARLNPPEAPTCECGGALIVAPAPYLLRGVFRLDRRIGAGGMGIVYHARDLNLDRSVAIKTLPRMTPEDAARLRREARAMAAVIHPNLAVIHGIETWQGVPFLIEEFLAGGSLSERLSRGPLAVNDALDMCATLAAVLDQLHRAGVIHRDVKPSNIGFTQADVVKLLDFGLARVVTGAAGPVETTRHPGDAPGGLLSTEHALVGTPAYMSPEARAGQRPRSSFDLWSLTVVLYEALTGRRPFDTRDPARFAAAVDAGDFPAPSATVAACGQETDAFFRRAFSADTALRPGDALSLRTMLIQLREAGR